MRRLLLALSAVLLLAVAAAPARAARTEPCRIGTKAPTCSVWTADVNFVHDGDTIDVDLRGDGSERDFKVRITGINATEQTVYTSHRNKRRGECHALEATARLEQLIKRGRGVVRLAAQNERSRSAGRLRRSVSVRINGAWQDVGRVMIAEGHALWLGNHTESAWNARYAVLAQQAATRRVGLWNPTYCGVGPDDEVALRLLVNWDADGTDGQDLNGEWATIRNLDPVRGISLGGWWFRDSALRRYRFPASAHVPPGGSVRVFVGDGFQTATDFFWNLDVAAFDNETYDERAMGDGGYLFDPQGDLRAWMMYPCRIACTDPLAGALDIETQSRRPESVTLRNVTGVAVDLEGYRLDSWPDGYIFGADSVVQPGEVMRVEIEGDPYDDERLVKHWGKDGEILANHGDKVTLRTLTDIVLGCDAWGDRSC